MLLEKARHKEGKGGYTSLWIDEVAIAVGLRSNFPEAITVDERIQIARAAIFDVASREVTADRLTKALKRCTEKHVGTPMQAYVIASSVTCRVPDALKRQVIHGATVTFSQVLPRRFDRSHVDGCREADLTKDDSRLTKVRVHLRARSWSEAHRRALCVVDSIRGMWNFVLLRGRWKEWAHERKPVNEILRGPVHTIHTPDGSRATDVIGYEPGYQAPKAMFNPTRKRKSFVDEYRFIRSTLKVHAFASDIEDAFLRYCQALDLRDPDLAFLRLWSLLEYLTATSKGGGGARRDC